MKKYTFILLFIVFLLGWFSNSTYSQINTPEQAPFSGNSLELYSPSDWIKEEQIDLNSQFLTLNIQDASLATYTDTNSMDPVLDYGAIGIEINAKSPDEIHIGDIVAYEPKWTTGLVVHRVIEKGIDSQGEYFITKGDNNADPDPKIRFNQIRFILIGVLY